MKMRSVVLTTISGFIVFFTFAQSAFADLSQQIAFGAANISSCDAGFIGKTPVVIVEAEKQTMKAANEDCQSIHADYARKVAVRILKIYRGGCWATLVKCRNNRQRERGTSQLPRSIILNESKA